MVVSEKRRLHTGDFELLVTPERGASVARCAWRRPDGKWVDLMRPAADDDINDMGGSLSKLSNFIMLPFVNRIDGASFEFEGAQCNLPLNRPEQNCAIHGLSRQRAWRVASMGRDHLECEDLFEGESSPYQYLARQRVEARGAELSLRLSVENRGDKAMPFGFGFHPWFPRTDATRLAFTAMTALLSDDRCMPHAAEPVIGRHSFERAELVSNRLDLDQHYAGWSGGAVISQPDLGYEIEIIGQGALANNVHIFCPSGMDLFCVEPVSHVTDVLNRREFAEHGDMARLEPGSVLSGEMILRPRMI